VTQPADEHRPDLQAPDPLEGVARDARTLRDVLTELEGLGFSGQFIARDAAEVECVACKARTAAAAFASHELRRLEGASDPSDMMIVVGLECPSCRQRGTLVLGYGPEASAADTDVVRLLDDD
jgi:hypothetical protein